MAFQPGLIEGGSIIDPRENPKVNPGGDGGHEGGGAGEDGKHFSIRLKRVQEEVYNGRHGHVWSGRPGPDSHVKITRSFNS
jgi:hypothetical protein|tara:strand:- start:740 stop:982 length:243 start_codon:yes stop_codon:yes gene_type:complete